MKPSTLLAFFVIVCLAASTQAGGEVTAWLKNLGCKIQKGAEDLSESAKPWAVTIGSTAKDFGSSVAQKYNEIKHKLIYDGIPIGTPAPHIDAPTDAASSAVPTPAASSAVPTPAASSAVPTLAVDNGPVSVPAGSVGATDA